MKNIKSFMWAIITAFKVAPIIFSFYFMLLIINSSLGVALSICIGEVITTITDSFSLQTEFYLILKLILYVGILIFSNSTLNLTCAYFEEHCYNMTGYKINKLLMDVTDNIPLRNFDNAEFCNCYSRVTDGMNEIPRFVVSLFSVGNIIYKLIISAVLLGQIHYILIIIPTVLFIIAILLNVKNVNTEKKYRVKVSNDKRRAKYIFNLFTNKIFNREFRLLNHKERYLNEYLDINNKVVEEKYNISKKGSKIFAFEFSIISDLSCLLIVVVSILLSSRNIISIESGTYMTIWMLCENFTYSGQNFHRAITSFEISFDKVKEAGEFIKKYKKSYKVDKELTVNDNPIEIENLRYQYNDEEFEISDINLSIPKGQIVALCGENGSGKSTLVKLMLGFYKPDNGSVKIYGVDAYDSPEKFINNKVGVVFQDFCQYPFTLRENIGFGDIKDMNDDDKIYNAIEKGDIDNILKKVKSIDSILGRELSEDGYELSGGEWQRVALTRSYMNEKDIMIFDEPAAKLDPLAELRQFNTIKTTLESKTAILISHRIGFARLADRIIVMKNGTIVEDGKHEDLLKLNGEYKRMFDNQARWYDYSYLANSNVEEQGVL